jgi:protein SCO1/2
MSLFTAGTLCAVAACAQGLNGAPAPLQSSPGLPPILQKVDFQPQINAQIPLGLLFRDETGRSVNLRQLLRSKPAILALVYYQCPMLCTQVEQGVASMLKAVKFDAGKQFNVIFVSFNPRETPELAAAKKKFVADYYHRDGTADGFHFLVGDEPAVQSLAGAAGFKYAYDPQTGLYAHASGILVLTPEGKISRYFYGVEYAPRDIRLALVEASERRVGTPIDRLLLFCWQYDPSTARYSASILGAVRLAGILTVLGIFLYAIFHIRRNARAVRPSRIG